MPLACEGMPFRCYYAAQKWDAATSDNQKSCFPSGLETSVLYKFLIYWTLYDNTPEVPTQRWSGPIVA